MKHRLILSALMLALIPLGGCKKAEQSGEKEITLLNVSYDPTRELYTDVNKAFIEKWEKEHGQRIKIDQSHGGSGKQARSVLDGIEADVVTLALSLDVEILAKGNLLP